MINAAALVADLKKQVLFLEDDLRQRITLPELDQAWRSEHAAATSGDRTAATYTAWADDRITQAAVSWVLTTTFVRFCEDNALLDPVWISGPAERRQEALDAQLAYFRAHPEHTDREWVEQAIAHLAHTPATAGLVDDQAMLHTVSPSGQSMGRLLEFWRRRTDEGALVHDFTDETLDTRFLGDLYQDLSDYAREAYALLQTPEFVEEFILDRTLEPALDDRPLDGFKLIDPACGSGHFLLGAFHRILGRWEKEAPSLGARERVQLALDSVWGVDINPFAAAIAVFRLTVAASRTIGITALEDSPGFAVHVLAGDSLWFSHDQEALFTLKDDFAYSTEHKLELIAALRRGQYDAVVANPPYITVKDKALNAGYRERYNHLKGKYQLTAPFMELLFKLAKSTEGAPTAGWVGQITSNAFMKREFGTPIIEELLAHLDLTTIIDTSGVQIPGHGTPTVILIGRNQLPNQGVIRVILGNRGEQSSPSVGNTGPVWLAITEFVDTPGHNDQWISVADMPRYTYSTHPWALTGGNAPAVSQRLDEAPRRFREEVASSGFSCITGDDEFLVGRKDLSRRLGAVSHPYAVGEDVRDYQCSPQLETLIPTKLDGSLIEPSPALVRHLWRGRTILRDRLYFGRKPDERGLRWFDYAIYFPERFHVHYRMVFAFVATHNHFILDTAETVFKQSAPVVILRDSASRERHLALLGVLNSSAACFWLKQNSYPKSGDPEPWANRYEFTGTTLQNFPLPKKLPLARARDMDNLAQQLSHSQVDALIASSVPTAELVNSAEAAQSSLQVRMIAHQEELDWEVYHSYGLVDEALIYGGELPEVSLGERAFEIVLARKVAAGEEETAWFSRHGSSPITEIPGHWPADYRELVRRRIDAIESVDAIRLLEASEYKRRWATEPFAKQADRALRGWLLDRLEDRSLWFTPQGQVRPQSVSQLADALGRDAEFVSVVELWQGRRDADLVAALTSLVESESVPYLAAHRLKDSGLRKFAEWQRTWALQSKEDAGEPVGTIAVPPKYSAADFRKTVYWSNRGKLDVPKERFILYPGAGRETDPTPLLGWAGWDHAQQSLALATIIHERIAEGAPDAQLVPLVAGLAELQPWVEQWHSELDPTFGVSPAQFSREQLSEHLKSLGLTVDDLAAWRPPAPTRGRRAAK